MIGARCMKRDSLYIFLLQSCITLSLIVLGYSIFQVGYSAYEEKLALQQWEEQAEQIEQLEDIDDVEVESLVRKDSNNTEQRLDKRENAQESNINLETNENDQTMEKPSKSKSTKNPPLITIGKLSIPKIKGEWPIIEGFSKRSLARGVGHYTESYLPGERGNTVLAGHRDSVFKRLAKVQENDPIIVETKTGTFTYVVTDIKIVDKDDRSVTLSSEKSLITLITCYPFYFVGDAPKRYILTAELDE